ncbi:thiol reductant ABC exporter subunit CydD [Lacisediminihabitans sp.]|uniref:thiol reductant ABC exporter subunit CydD n=1 Tax=Lacisediminihabitans sp. TaxID=2787631 RepID=UPI00374D00E4
MTQPASEAASRSPFAGLSALNRPTLYLLGLLSALKAGALIVLATALAAGIVSVIGGGTAWMSALGWGLAAGVLRAGVAWVHRVVSARAMLGAKERLRAQLAEHAMGERGSGGPTGSVVTLATDGLDELDKYFTVFLPALVTAATVPLIVGARILFADWVSAVVIVLTVPLIPVFMALIGLHTRERVTAATDALARLSDHLVELARGLPVLVGLGRAHEQAESLRSISDRYRSRTVETLKTAFLSSLALELIATISVAVVAVFIGVRLVVGDLSLELGLLILVLAPECFTPLRVIGTAFHASQDGREALTRVERMLARRPGDRLVSAGPCPVRVEGLTVRFGDRGAPSVNALHFEAPTAQITVLDGQSGAGKSTVFAVLADRLVTGAGVSVSGTVTGVEPGRIAWLPQHPRVAAATVGEELALYSGDETPAAAVHGVLRRLGLVRLEHADPSLISPGELRRVAFARVLLRVRAGATLVLLDEPTAHLDRASAALVVAEIAGLRGSATVIVASHDARVRDLADTLVPLGRGGRASSVGLELPAGADEAPRRPPFLAETSPARTGRALASFLRPVVGRVLGAVLLGTLASLFAIALTALSGWLIVRASQHPPIMFLLVAIVGVRFFGIGRAVLRYSDRLLSHSAVFSAVTELRARLWTALADRGLRDRSLLSGGSALERLVRDVDRVRDLSIRAVLPLVVGALTVVATIAALGLIEPRTLPIFLGLAVAGLVLAPTAAILADSSASRAQQALRSRVLRRFAAMLGAAADLRVNGVDGRLRRQLRRLDAQASEQARRGAWALGLGSAIVVLSCCAAAVLVLPVTALAVARGTLRPELVAVLALTPLALIDPLLDLVAAAQQWPSLRAVLARVSAVTEPSEVDRAAGAVPPERITSLALRGVSAAWPGSGPVFTGVDAEVRSGEWLVVTGPSGSGKSTMLAVLLAQLRPVTGRLEINGRDAAAMDALSLGRRIGWCPQEAHLFNSTLRANLLIARGRDDAPDTAEMTSVLTRVGLGPLLDRLPNGLDTAIGAEGSSLSGGERQRVAVARTLLTRADVVLLDEPTAHLDEEAAEQLIADLVMALHDRVTVLVTHQATAGIPSANRIDLGRRPTVMPTAQSGLVVSGAA